MNSPVILITGAGKGIGQAIVLDALRRKKTELPGLKLFLTARTEKDLIALQILCAAEKVDCEIFPQELASSDNLNAKEIVRVCIERFGRIDYLIHSAGVGVFGNFLDFTENDFKFVMDTNVKASFFLMQATYTQMKKQGGGSIVWITSVAAEKPFEHGAIYCMSKFAQKGLIDVMRLHAYRDQIRMIEVKPGATYTPMWGEVTHEMKEKMMEASDVAKIILDALSLPSRTSVEEITIRPISGDLN